jgi:hypothetical protein
MPSVSKAQQRLFGLVRSVQKGEKDSSSVSPAIKKMASKLKPSSVEKYASTKHAKLPEKLKEILYNESHPVISQLQECVNGKQVQINETTVDAFTANLLLTVAKNLSEDNREKFLDLPLEKMVATAYKIVTTQVI